MLLVARLAHGSTIVDRRQRRKETWRGCRNEDPRPLPWPLFTIDFEASGLQPRNFPIEVGVCRWRSPDHPVEGWSTLIRPTQLWVEHGTWSTEAQQLHGIAREQLETGMTPADAITVLNTIIGNHAAFCDGGASDFAWARRLVLAAGTMNRFRLGDFDMLTGCCDANGYARLVRWLDRTPARHRARDDAERLMKALARGLGLKHETPVAVELIIPRPEDATFDGAQFLRDKEAARQADDEALRSGASRVPRCAAGMIGFAGTTWPTPASSWTSRRSSDQVGVRAIKKSGLRGNERLEFVYWPIVTWPRPLKGGSRREKLAVSSRMPRGKNPAGRRRGMKAARL